MVWKGLIQQKIKQCVALSIIIPLFSKEEKEKLWFLGYISYWSPILFYKAKFHPHFFFSKLHLIRHLNIKFSLFILNVTLSYSPLNSPTCSFTFRKEQNENVFFFFKLIFYIYSNKNLCMEVTFIQSITVLPWKTKILYLSWSLQ